MAMVSRRLHAKFDKLIKWAHTEGRLRLNCNGAATSIGLRQAIIAQTRPPAE
jgi:hypothetical protein